MRMDSNFRFSKHQSWVAVNNELSPRQCFAWARQTDGGTLIIIMANLKPLFGPGFSPPPRLFSVDPSVVISRSTPVPN
jgi:hypothetical protein